ncbi:DNA cytosine methyltransferase [Changpingibacter yushuensis]|uniref:DNA cytosine methyltransferase n=1 Tax=Changpingibacter yushuensis TaxID=2758440 RepID=UPI0015F36F7C|nr:DNA cytosine methyltransferase [Changpingibacter yushuensis]
MKGSGTDGATDPIGTFVSLYAGAGGLDIGFARAGFAPVWVNELNPVALATHEAALARLGPFSCTSFAGDLLTIPAVDLPQQGSADLVIGGPPCQGFSIAGKMDPNDHRSTHVFHFMDMVERVRPRAFVMENVKALHTNAKWSHVRESLMSRANGLGYSARRVLVNASDFGVPQNRERMFLLGVRRDIGEPRVPIPTTAGAPVTVREALSSLPHYTEPGNDSLCRARITVARHPVVRRSAYAGMLFNGAGRPLDLGAPSPTLPASMGGNRTPIIDQRWLDESATGSWVEDYHARLMKMGADGVDQMVPGFLRRLTVQEAAAIQTFPPDMHWCGPVSAQFRQIGNAVPPLLGFALAQAVRSSLGLA